jgi:hypothetical protein
MQNSDQVDFGSVEGDEEKGENLRDRSVKYLLLLVIDFPTQRVQLARRPCFVSYVFHHGKPDLPRECTSTMILGLRILYQR